MLTVNHANPQRSASGRDHTSKKRAARKRQGGRRDNDGLPASISERMRVLVTTVHQLTAQLHEERVQAILDLRIAGGFVTQKERSEPYDGLVKICARINNSLTQAETSGLHGGVSYIA